MNVVIFGAGIAGLTASHYLVKQGYNVVIIETLPVAGGLARSNQTKTLYYLNLPNIIDILILCLLLVLIIIFYKNNNIITLYIKSFFTIVYLRVGGLKTYL